MIGFYNMRQIFCSYLARRRSVIVDKQQYTGCKFAQYIVLDCFQTEKILKLFSIEA
jgi:hypothetical protein